VTLNKVLVIGNVGNDPEMRYTPSGSPVTSFNVAANWRYTSSDGEQHEETEWFRVNAWDRLAEQCNQYVTKGMKVYVEGRLKSSPWMDREGQPRAGNEIRATDVRFLDSRAQAEGEEGESRAESRAEPRAESGAEPRAESGTEDAEGLPW